MVKSLGDNAVTVLGNHDLHLLAVAAGATELHRSDTLDEILNAPDRVNCLLGCGGSPCCMPKTAMCSYAGLLPQWGIKQAIGLAREVEQALRGDDYANFFAQMYGNSPRSWDDDLGGYKRLRVISNAFTRCVSVLHKVRWSSNLKVKWKKFQRAMYLDSLCLSVKAKMSQ